MDFNPYSAATPLLLGMNALLCVGFYRNYRRQPYLLWLVAFLVFLALGLSTQLLMTAAQRYTQVLVTTGLYLAAVMCLAHTMALRMRRQLQWGAMVCACMLTMAAMWYFSNVYPDMRIRLGVLSIGTAVIKLLTLLQLRDVRRLHKLDRLSLALYALTAMALLLRPLLVLLSNDPMDSDAISEHTSWVFTSIAAMLLCSLLTLSLNMSLLVDTNIQLRRERNQDVLTGLLNRRAWIEHCAPVPYAHGIRTLLTCDLDHFKRINDTYGHAAGDAVLQTFGAILRHQVRGQDIAARLGGEEFALALHGTPLPQAQQLAQRIANALQNHHWQHPQLPADFQVTVSFGVVAVQPAETLGQALKRTDALLYAAKRAGRNRIHSESSLTAH